MAGIKEKWEEEFDKKFQPIKFWSRDMVVSEKNLSEIKSFIQKTIEEEKRKAVEPLVEIYNKLDLKNCQTCSSSMTRAIKTCVEGKCV